MKKKNFAAAFIIAALIGMVSLSACNGGCSANKQGSFSFPDYAVALDNPSAAAVNFNERSYVHGVYSNVATTDFTSLESIGSQAYGLAKAGKADGSFALYDMKEGKELFSGSSLNPRTSGSVTYFEIVLSGNSGYRFIGPDGKLLADKVFNESSSFSLTAQGGKYVNGKSADIYVAEYPSDESHPDQKTEIYFAEYTDIKGNKTWGRVSKEDITPTAAPEYSVGDILQPERKEIFDSEAYPGCNLKGYTYTVENSSADAENGTYTFYGQDGNKTGAVTLYDNCTRLAFVGNYFYFYGFTPVREDSTKHYNIEIVTGSSTIKYNYVLYRYNFVDGGDRAEEIATDYVVIKDFGKVTELYNYAADSFDRFYAVAFKMQDKFAVIGQGSRTYKIVFDENMSICADLSASAIDLSEPVYKLKENRYLSGNTIYDENCRTVAPLPEGKISVWEEQQLLVCAYNGKTLFVDFDGKVAIKPVPSAPSNLEVYGASVYAGSIVYNKQNPSGVEIGKLVNAGEGDAVSYHNGVICKKSGTESPFDYSIYDLEGKFLGVISTSRESLVSQKIGGKLVFKGYVDGSPAVWIIG